MFQSGVVEYTIGTRMSHPIQYYTNFGKILNLSGNSQKFSRKTPNKKTLFSIVEKKYMMKGLRIHPQERLDLSLIHI